MGTNNFASPSNAKDYYVVLTNREEEIDGETQYFAPDEWEIDDLKDNILSDIKAQGGFESRDTFCDRNYERTALGELEETRVYADVEVGVRVVAVLQNAYYEGATLDYLIYVTVEGDEWKYSTGSYFDENIESILDEVGEIQSYRGLNNGMVSIIRPKVESFLEATIDTLSEKMDNILEAYSEHKLKKVGQFSNGEAVYQKV